MKDSVKETLKRLGVSLTKETDKGTCVKTSYELLEEKIDKTILDIKYTICTKQELKYIDFSLHFR